MAGTGVSKPSRWLLGGSHGRDTGSSWLTTPVMGSHGDCMAPFGWQQGWIETRGSVSLSRPEELTTLWWITLSSEERGGCCWSRTRPALTL